MCVNAIYEYYTRAYLAYDLFSNIIKKNPP